MSYAGVIFLQYRVCVVAARIKDIADDTMSSAVLSDAKLRDLHSLCEVCKMFIDENAVALKVGEIKRRSTSREGLGNIVFGQPHSVWVRGGKNNADVAIRGLYIKNPRKTFPFHVTSF